MKSSRVSENRCWIKQWLMLAWRRILVISVQNSLALWGTVFKFLIWRRFLNYFPKKISFENWSLLRINLNRAINNSNKRELVSIINHCYLYRVFIGLWPDLHYQELFLKHLLIILKFKAILLEAANLEVHFKKGWGQEYQKVVSSAQSQQLGQTHRIANFLLKEPRTKKSDLKYLN